MEKQLNKILAGLFLLLSSVVFAQQTPPFWNEIQQFRKQDSVQPLSKNPIVFTGSSTIRLWPGLEHAFKNRHPIMNRGFGGSTLPDVIHYEQDVIFKYHPAQIFIYCGDNDLASSDTITANIVYQRFVHLFTDIRKALPNVPLVFISIKPSPSRWHLKDKMIEANTLIKNFLSKQKQTAFVSVWSAMLDKEGKPIADIFREDKLHMNEKGYAIWQRIIEPYLLK